MTETREDDPLVFVYRAQAVMNRIDRLVAEAYTADPKRRLAIRDEVALCELSLYDIREEQLADKLKPRAKPRRWWHRWLRPKATEEG